MPIFFEPIPNTKRNAKSKIVWRPGGLLTRFGFPGHRAQGGFPNSCLSSGGGGGGGGGVINRKLGLAFFQQEDT